jgi:hypothetical protein
MREEHAVNPIGNTLSKVRGAQTQCLVEQVLGHTTDNARRRPLGAGQQHTWNRSGYDAGR